MGNPREALKADRAVNRALAALFVLAVLGNMLAAVASGLLSTSAPSVARATISGAFVGLLAVKIVIVIVRIGRRENR